MGKLASTSTTKTARAGTLKTLSEALLPTPALELQLCMERGLDPTTAPSSTFSNGSSVLAAVDLLLVLEMRPGARPGFRKKSSREKLELPTVKWTL